MGSLNMTALFSEPIELYEKRAAENCSANSSISRTRAVSTLPCGRR